MNFGAFVDIGGIDGLLHITELGWKRVNHPSEVLHEGDNVEVYVLKVDHEKEKVSLSLKKLAADPWMEGISKYEEGSVVKGKVVRILPFGAFVQLEPGLEGLVHISQISEKRINKVEDVLEVGQEINVKIVQISEEDKRIKLSMKDIVKDEEKEEITTFLNEQSEADDNVTIGDLVKTINLKNETEENKAVAKTKTEEAPKAVEIKTNESNDPDEDVVNNESTKKLGKTKKAEK